MVVFDGHGTCAYNKRVHGGDIRLKSWLGFRKSIVVRCTGLVMKGVYPRASKKGQKRSNFLLGFWPPSNFWVCGHKQGNHRGLPLRETVLTGKIRIAIDYDAPVGAGPCACPVPIPVSELSQNILSRSK